MLGLAGGWFKIWGSHLVWKGEGGELKTLDRAELWLLFGEQQTWRVHLPRKQNYSLFVKNENGLWAYSCAD